MSVFARYKTFWPIAGIIIAGSVVTLLVLRKSKTNKTKEIKGEANDISHGDHLSAIETFQTTETNQIKEEARAKIQERFASARGAV